jgi:hypothetical protein
LDRNLAGGRGKFLGQTQGLREHVGAVGMRFAVVGG